MDALTDFKPIELIELPGAGAVEPRGLIVIVGPNSSGKSQLLQDIYRNIAGERRDLVVAKQLVIRKPEQWEPFKEWLIRTRRIKSYYNDEGVEQMMPTQSYLGTGGGGGPFQADLGPRWLSSVDEEARSRARRPINFHQQFGKLLVGAMFLENRLTALRPGGVFDFETTPPHSDVQSLHIHETAKEELLEEIRRTFGKDVWPDPHRGTLELKVSDERGEMTPEVRLSATAMAKFRTIETEGDGLKSYAATCVALLLGERPVLIVDEPEMCLHPPQAYNLGRFIGRHGKRAENATIVATHSSHILRGIIHETQELQVIRLTRRGSSFTAHRLSPDELSVVTNKPAVTAETVLDGIFAQAVAIIEAHGDRVVYQAVAETLSDEIGMDIHFTAVGGTGGIAEAIAFYRRLRIPAVVVADLDILLDIDKLRRITNVLSPGRTTDSLLVRARKLCADLKLLPPTITAVEVGERLAEAAALPRDWDTHDDEALRRTLSKLANDIDRMRRIKRGGTHSLPKKLADTATALISDFAQLGLFIVPVGELEEWLAAHAITASKDAKPAWAMQAAQKVRDLGQQQGDIWDFMRAISGYLRQTIDGA